jgi:Alginate lyase
MKTYLIIALSLISCAFAPQTSAALSGTVLITDARIAAIKSRVQNQVQPNYKAYQAMKSYVDAHQFDACQAPAVLNVDPLYTDPQGHHIDIKGIDHDSVLAYKLALAYRITGNETYAANCARILNCWATKTTFSPNGVTKLTVSTRAPSFIVAADLIKRSAKFTPAQQQNFQIFTRHKLLPMNTGGSTGNNWSNWGVLLETCVAAYLHDQALFNKAVGQWKSLIQDQMTYDGVMKYEIGRTCPAEHGGGNCGIWYSNFALYPQTTSAEIMKINGVNVFGYVSPNGRTLKKAYGKMAYWCRYPCTFPYGKCPTYGLNYVSYMEVLNPIWPNANAAYLLGKYRPLDSKWSFPVFTLTHGNLKL